MSYFFKTRKGERSNFPVVYIILFVPFTIFFFPYQTSFSVSCMTFTSALSLFHKFPWCLPQTWNPAFWTDAVCSFLIMRSLSSWTRCFSAHFGTLPPSPRGPARKCANSTFPCSFLLCSPQSHSPHNSASVQFLWHTSLLRYIHTAIIVMSGSRLIQWEEHRVGWRKSEG